MAETIEYEQFDPSADAGVADPSSQVDLSRLSEIPMELSVEIGRTHMTVGETLDLCVGSVVTLERLAGETADLLVNGSAIARGEVVVIDEQYGLRITEILDGRHDDDEQTPAVSSVSHSAGGAPPPPPAAAAPPAPAPPPDAPLADAPLADAPLADAPLADVPLGDAPLADEPVVDAEVVDAPIADEPPAGAGDAEDPSAEEA